MARGEVPPADAYAPPGMNSQVCINIFLLFIIRRDSLDNRLPYGRFDSGLVGWESDGGWRERMEEGHETPLDIFLGHMLACLGR